MNYFVNRERELGTLNTLYQQSGSQLVVLYGRRRLGKTTLLREFSKDKACVYHMADLAGEVSQRNALARTMAEALDESLLEQLEYSTWYDLFAAFDRMRPQGQKLVLMLDEYQYLCQTQAAFSSYVQKWWDEQWKQGNLMVILCGSLTSMMYRETLAHSSPLYGRSDGQILLRPFSYAYVSQFVDRPSEVRCVERYALCGGIPRYLELLARYKSFDEALIEGVLNPVAPLHNEARYLLQGEIDVPNTCWSLLEAIASGATRISELASRLKMPASSLTRYISLLRDLSIVEREVPVGEKNPAKSKRGMYAISDPFLRLWFGSVYPYESFFEMGDAAISLEKIRPRLNRHIEGVYEELCRSYVAQKFTVSTESVRMGRQWGAHYEIDVAGVNASGEFTLFGECKWSRQKVGRSILRDLQEKVEQNRLPVAPNVRWILFSRSGFTSDLLKYAETHSEIILVDQVFK